MKWFKDLWARVFKISTYEEIARENHARLEASRINKMAQVLRSENTVWHDKRHALGDYVAKWKQDQQDENMRDDFRRKVLGEWPPKEDKDLQRKHRESPQIDYELLKSGNATLMGLSQSVPVGRADSSSGGSD